MIQLMCYSITLILSLIFMQMNHPLAMGLMLLIQTIMICLLTGLMTKTFWFSYILFLIFLGGMLVLFIYVCSLASNEMFSMSMKIILNTSCFMGLMMIIYLIIDPQMLYLKMFNEEMSLMINEMSYFYENNLNLNKLYNYPTNMLTIILMNYLLITLIAVVKITKLFYGPLRQMN